jgi:hypothetical protein
MTLDTSTLNLEPFLVYHVDREAFHRLIAVSAASLSLLRSVVGLDPSGELLGALVDTTGEPWPKKKRFPKPMTLVDAASGSLGNLLVVQALSSFDTFTISLIEDGCEFAETIRQRPAFSHEHVDLFANDRARRTGCCHNAAARFALAHGLDDRVEALADALGTSLPANLIAVLPLFHLFRRARNRIAHANGSVGDGLEEFMSSAELKAALAAWDASFAKRPSPALPSLTTGQTVTFQARHAILASAVNYVFAKWLSEQVASAFGESGALRMAVYYSLGAGDHSHRAASHKHPEGPVAHFLFSRFRIRNADRSSTAEALRRRGLWRTTVTLYQLMYGARD